MPADPSPRPHRPLQPLPSHAPLFILPCAGPSSLSLHWSLSSPCTRLFSGDATPLRVSLSPCTRVSLSAERLYAPGHPGEQGLAPCPPPKRARPALLVSHPLARMRDGQGCGRTSAQAQGAAQAQTKGGGRRGRGTRAAAGRVWARRGRGRTYTWFLRGRHTPLVSRFSVEFCRHTTPSPPARPAIHRPAGTARRVLLLRLRIGCARDWRRRAMAARPRAAQGSNTRPGIRAPPLP
jgi:hypothetical protein